MKVYISGPISGLTEAEYTTSFGLAEAILLDMGHDPVSPLKVLACESENCNLEGSVREDGSYLHSWACYMKHDIKAMMDCNAFVALPNRHLSRGATIEFNLATELSMKRIYLKE